MTSNGTLPPTDAAASRTALGHTQAANGSILYLLVTLALVGWLLFDTWMDVHSLPRLAGYDMTRLQTPTFHLVAYTMLGGAFGGILNGIRSVLAHYRGFDRQYVWKYIAGPWMGAALALLGYALLHSTVAVLGGQGANVGSNTTQTLANFAVGALAGYGAKDVFVWLDKQVENSFGVPVPKGTPNVEGQPEGAAAADIQSQRLSVGSVTTVPTGKGAPEGTVVGQSPAPETPIMRGDSVNLTVADSQPTTDSATSPARSADDLSETAPPTT